MANHFLNISYSIDETNGFYQICVRPGDDVGMTDLVYKDQGKELARISVLFDQLPLLIDALQRRLEDVKREEDES